MWMSHAQAGLSEREAWQGTAPAGAVLSYTVRGGGVGEAWGMRQEAASSRVVGSWLERLVTHACGHSVHRGQDCTISATV